MKLRDLKGFGPKSEEVLAQVDINSVEEFMASNPYVLYKELKKKIVGKLNDKTFFTLASERIEGKFKRGPFSVAKAELSILYNIE